MTQSTHTTARSGISLLEVLISVFVLSIGVLGIAALIPVGRHQVVEAAKADRGSTLGRGALHELRIRGLLHPLAWLYADGNGSPYINPQSGLPQPPSQPIPALQLQSNQAAQPPFAIDPLLIARTRDDMTNGASAVGQLQEVATFPYPHGQPTPNLPANMPRFARFTLRGWMPTPSASFPQTHPGFQSVLGMQLSLADRIFRARDELVFKAPGDVQAGNDVAPRPALMYSYDTSGTPPQPLERLDEGNYSWLVTVSPDLTELLTLPGGPRRHTVSIVVFYKRDLRADPRAEKPNERTILAEIIGGGLGGGDVRLLLPSNIANAPGASTWLDIRPNQWLMLSAKRYPSGGSVLQWYRVVSVEPESVPGQRFATLAGPDWQSNMFIDAISGRVAGAGGSVPTVFATIFDGVAAVYEKTIELPGVSMWAN